MSTPCRGRIVWVEIVDPQGRNPKLRPAVIVSATEAIQEGGQVWCVAVSSQLDEAPAEEQVELPWHRDGHPRTQLRQRCAAVCSWLVPVSLDAIRQYAGTVPGRQLNQILQRVDPLPPLPDPTPSDS